MGILDRYLARSVILGTLITLAIVAPLIGLFVFSEEVSSIGENDYTFANAVQYSLLNSPRYLYSFLPIATLIGSLVGIGILASSSQIVAMRAAGVSITQIIRASMLGGLVIVVFGWILGEVIAPWSFDYASRHFSGKHSEQSQQLSNGFWTYYDNAYVHIGVLESDKKLKDVTEYRFEGKSRDRKLQVAHADNVQYKNNAWQLNQMTINQVSFAGVIQSKKAHEQMDKHLDPKILDVLVANHRSLSLIGLYRYVQFMANNGQQNKAYEVLFWNRVFQPIYILSMLFIAVPVAMTSARSRSIGRHIFTGIILGICYYVLSRMFSTMAVQLNISSLILTLLPPLIFVAIGVVLMRRSG